MASLSYVMLCIAGQSPEGALWTHDEGQVLGKNWWKPKSEREINAEELPKQASFYYVPLR